MKKRNTKENAIRNVPFSLRVNTLNVEEATHALLWIAVLRVMKSIMGNAIKNASRDTVLYIMALSAGEYVVSLVEKVIIGGSLVPWFVLKGRKRAETRFIIEVRVSSLTNLLQKEISLVKDLLWIKKENALRQSLHQNLILNANNDLIFCYYYYY